MHTPKVYIVILNYRQWQDTRDCLESVLRSSYTNYSVLVIDNNSQNDSLGHLSRWLDNTIFTDIPSGTASAGKATRYALLKREETADAIVLSHLPAITLIQNDVNAGFAGGNNVVLRMLRDKDAFVWLLNPDMTIKEDTLQELVSFTIQQPPNSIIGAVVRFYAGNQELLFYGGGKVNFYSATVSTVKNHSEAGRLDYISGACLFMHASCMKELGLLPEEYFLYWEETDWCYRAKQKGYRLLVCPTAVCYDKISTVIGKSFLADYYYVRNGLLFVLKFRKKNIPVVLFFMGIRWLKRIFTGRWARAKGVYKGTRDFLKKKRDEAK